MNTVELLHGDCLELMKDIPNNSIDMVLTDPPYGTTACKWDTVIPFEPMWEQLKRITKDNGVICLFGSEPFSSHLRLSNLKMFKYDWVWHKNKPTGALTSKFMPMKNHETISVFVGVGRPTFNKQMEDRDASKETRKRYLYDFNTKTKSGFYGDGLSVVKPSDNQKRNPTTVRYAKCVPSPKQVHPTQKPVALLEYLIKTYTLKNEIVLDFTMGSGSTGVACKKLSRNFIGIEKEQKYYDIAKERIYG